MPLDPGDAAAIVILAKLHMEVSEPHDPYNQIQGWACTWITHAIRHLAYPDRDVYPKTRKGTKSRPVIQGRWVASWGGGYDSHHKK